LKNLSSKVKDAEAKIRKIDGEWQKLYLSIPNIPHESVSIRKTENNNVTVATWRFIEYISPHAIPHYEIPWFSNVIDFQRGIKATGAGFPFYN
jgi:seryl-tRNA synthetase